MNYPLLRRYAFLFALIGLIALPALPGRVASAQQSSGEPVVARISVHNETDFQRLANMGVDLLEMRDGDDLFILTTRDQVDGLRGADWTVSVDDTQTALLGSQGDNLDTFTGGYRTVVEMQALLYSKATQYPNLAETFVYGSSWRKITSGGSAGFDLLGIKLTNELRPGPKPTFFLMAGIHAREVTTPELALRFIDYLLANYGVDGDATWLLDEHQIVVVPTVNPDGHVLAEQGYYQRKNVNDTNGGNCPNPPTASDQHGVDMNRNSNFKWGTINPPNTPPCSQPYPGPFAASEPETTALANLVRSLFPDQRGPLDTDAAPLTTTGNMLTLHSYGNLVLWPWGWTGATAPNSAGLTLIGQKYASYNGYTPQQSIYLYPTSGTTDDWAYGELGIPAMTFEVGSSAVGCGGFFPAFSCLDGGTGGSLWPINLPAFLHAARIARAPYQLAQGPSPETATATIVGTNQYDLRAQLSEVYSGGQLITGAEYYIDTPPWSGGAAHPMTPLDGNFNSTIETATAIVGPIAGRHLFYVRGRDTSGNWGPVRAVFTPGQPARSISGTISYCIDPAKKVPNAPVNTTAGVPSASTVTNSLGGYQLTGLAGGPYTVAPSKAAQAPGTVITAFDAALVAQLVAGLSTPNGCQQLGGDASNNGALTALDAAYIAQTVAGIGNPGIAGTWKFLPSSRSYSSLENDQTNQNYDAVLVGDVSGDWTPAGPEGPSQPPAVSIPVSLPNTTAGKGPTNVVVPVTVGDTTGLNVIAYDFTVTFDPRVIQLANPTFETNGTLSQGWSVTPNTSTPGRIRIVAFNASPLRGSGTLIFLKFRVVGARATPLTWANFLFNEGNPGATLINGTLKVKKRAGGRRSSLLPVTTREYFSNGRPDLTLTISASTSTEWNWEKGTWSRLTLDGRQGGQSETRLTN